MSFTSEKQYSALVPVFSDHFSNLSNPFWILALSCNKTFQLYEIAHLESIFHPLKRARARKNHSKVLLNTSSYFERGQLTSTPLVVTHCLKR